MRQRFTSKCISRKRINLTVMHFIPPNYSVTNWHCWYVSKIYANGIRDSAKSKWMLKFVLTSVNCRDIYVIKQYNTVNICVTSRLKFDGNLAASNFTE